MSAIAVSIDQVTKKFGNISAVDGATLSIKKGECYGLLGPNGAGKSTLIRMLYGATSRSAGSMTVLGLDPQTEGRNLRKKLGVVTQEDALDEQMTVVENMILYASFHGLEKKKAMTKIETY